MPLNAAPNEVLRSDPRFDVISRENNLRFPATEAETASRIVLCSNAEQTADALQRIVASGMRPTVRSGGHCYEDFVANNPGGAIIDVSLHNLVTADADGSNVSIAPGAVLGDIYRFLYKGWGTVIPGGSCYRVGAGGHISGGGFGSNSRWLGLTVDYVTAVDILTVDAHGKVINRHVDKDHDADLFRACRGGGGGNFGIVNAFHCAKLPAAPYEVAASGVSFPWADMTLEKFTKILTTFGDYWAGRGQERSAWGLFSGLNLSPRSANGRLNIGAHFCNDDGRARDLTVLREYLDGFKFLNPIPSAPRRTTSQYAAPDTTPHVDAGKSNDPYKIETHLWIDGTVAGGGNGIEGIRAKYKSAYMKKSFTAAECAAFYKWLTADSAMNGVTVLINSYGGAINKPGLAEDTAVSQRNSVMKLQWINSWAEKAEDEARIKYLNDFYTDVYTGDHVPAEYQGTPFGPRYEGCYMNYADVHMLNYNFWPQLYYGEHYPFLQQVKKKYDPNNIFHSAMSIRG
jgi:FAD/FMN-containing dehydrogenase